MKNKKMISGLLLFTITSYMTIPVFAASKSETVYSNLDSNGKAYKTIVSTQLTNEDKSDEITDISNLLNIENTNGDETFKKEGNKIVWDSNGNNIYYKGESDKQLPVECKITYELNGEEISAEELKGKSGNVKIKINYTNNEKHIVSINGKQVTMYTPFIIVAGTKIDNAKNKNIQITNGKIVDNGESTLAVGIAMPGNSIGTVKNIGISKSKIDIPEEIEISMETEDFEMGNIIAVVAVKGIDEDLTSDLNSMYSQINELANASNEILAGANQLKEGTSELVSGVDQLKDGTGAAYAGSKQIKDEVEESTKNLKNDNTPAIDSKTLEAIKAQAMQSATLSDEQKAGIAAQAKVAATLSDEQKAGIAAQAKAGAKLTDAQKAGIAAQAKAAAKLTDAQKAEIAAQAKLTDEQKAKITAQAKAGAEFTETQKTAIIEQAQKKYTETLTEAEKQLILTVAQNTAYQTATTTALAVAESTAEATALKVAQSVAESTAEATALKVAQSVAESTAEATAQTVAQSTATQTAETTALTVAQSTATQTAGATATQVGNQAKQKFTNQVVSQMSTLGTALDELTNGLANIDNGVSALSVGTNKLDSGALQLANGVKTFNEQGISKINNLVNGDLRNIASRVEKMNELANEYNNYAGIQNGMAGEVKFIMITDSTTGNGEVKKEEAVITTEAKDSKEIKENKEE